MDNSEAYERAYQKSRAASARYTEAQRRYRAREISDAEYLAARTAYDIAAGEFDDAFDAEQRRQEGGQA